MIGLPSFLEQLYSSKVEGVGDDRLVWLLSKKCVFEVGSLMLSIYGFFEYRCFSLETGVEDQGAS